MREPASLRLVSRKRNVPDAPDPYFRVSLKQFVEASKPGQFPFGCGPSFGVSYGHLPLRQRRQMDMTPGHREAEIALGARSRHKAEAERKLVVSARFDARSE